MIVFSTEPAGAARVVHVHGAFDGWESGEALAARLDDEHPGEPMVVDLTDVEETPGTDAFLLRLEIAAPRRPIALVHAEAHARRRLRARTRGLMVAPDVDHALQDGLHLTSAGT